jgi:transketolase
MGDLKSVGIRASVDANAGDIERRAKAIRGHIVAMIGRLGEGYLLQGLGAADLFATLFFSELRLDPKRPDWEDRDRLILSTAHNSTVLYAALAERGYFDIDKLASYGVDGSDLEIIASEDVAGVEGTFGSLGQGLSVALGMALFAKRYARTFRVYVVLGDGELQEGQVWEAAMAAASFRLDNLCLIIDRNDMQVEGHCSSVLDMGDVAAKWGGFGWAVQQICGHDISALLAAFEQARSNAGRPSVILARTITGKGVPFLEGSMNHYAKLSAAEAEAALALVGGR